MKYLLLVMGLLAMGCAKPPAQSGQARFDLMAIAMQYHQFASEHKTPPKSVQELANFTDPYSKLVGNQAATSASQAALQSGDYVVIWSYDVTADLPANKSLILAYHKDVPNEGGYVAFADAMVRQVSQDEFATTAKATPQSTTADNAASESVAEEAADNE